MGRPRKPTEILELNGSLDHNPSRRREIGPKSDQPIGDPPVNLPADVRAAWFDTANEAVEGVLTAADTGPLEIIAGLRAKTRRGKATVAEMGLLLRAYTELGMTPASRSKVTLTAPKKAAPEVPWGFLTRAKPATEAKDAN